MKHDNKIKELKTLPLALAAALLLPACEAGPLPPELQVAVDRARHVWTRTIKTGSPREPAPECSERCPD